MAEYIEREALLLQIDLHGTNKFGMLDEDIREFVKKQPTADVVEVRHGEWEFVQIDDCIICSECKNSWNVIDNCTETFNYCPNCGAKMDGERKRFNAGFAADYLLANGVIVPPCKYGDTIYEAIFHKDGTGFCVERKVVGFHMGEFPKLRGQERQQYFIVFHEATNSISHINFKEIGKTIFFTREETEQALEART